ncbi:hypothetical protein CAPTEDRAFT_123498 [Capitella teleta]|uniref:Uncharacterized protein n=1 Tax=Capitella teleta TaxID=283909 RepID=R7TEE4_CAPTE|nr:hypothetical protein CAPTEDRAFT_123498 [Capitella teleta]|eukprot:ELT89842.1 hypothetical protein CAPTEDRAFT_123498 [Capitella teleta]
MSVSSILCKPMCLRAKLLLFFPFQESNLKTDPLKVLCKTTHPLRVECQIR